MPCQVCQALYIFYNNKKTKEEKKKKKETICAKPVHTDFFLFFLQESFKYDLKHKYILAFVCSIHDKVMFDVGKSGEQFPT